MSLARPWEKKQKPPGSDFSMRLGSSYLERVVIPYTNSSSTNPSAKVVLFSGDAKGFLRFNCIIFFNYTPNASSSQTRHLQLRDDLYFLLKNHNMKKVFNNNTIIMETLIDLMGTTPLNDLFVWGFITTCWILIILEVVLSTYCTQSYREYY